MQLHLLVPLIGLLLSLGPRGLRAVSSPDSFNFNYPEFSARCAPESAAVRRRVALELARIRFERERGAGTLSSAPVRLDARGCVELRKGVPRLPLDVMVDSLYYAASWFTAQFGGRPASHEAVLDALTAEVWSNLMPGSGQRQVLTVRAVLARSGWYAWYDSGAKFAHDLYLFYHGRWRRQFLLAILRDEDEDGCLTIGEFARSVCIQTRYMERALASSGGRTRALRRRVLLMRRRDWD